MVDRVVVVVVGCRFSVGCKRLIDRVVDRCRFKITVIVIVVGCRFKITVIVIVVGCRFSNRLV